MNRDIACSYTTNRQEETRSQALKRKYEETQGHATVCDELYEMIQKKPMAEVEDIIRRIRSGDDLETIIHTVQEGELLLQLSASPTESRHEDNDTRSTRRRSIKRSMSEPLADHRAREQSPTFHR